ncbi:MAG: fibronectin type III domain-containing protein, partial [Firmicutes bacterium]|nr:fibronectin type III domain-containing protein [Bacillota bacterium]
GTRNWFGTYYLAAVYSKALSSTEVQQNYNAGYGDSAPADPSALSATAVSTTEIGLTWQDNSTDETGFEIHRSLNATTGFSLVSTQAANVVSYNDTGLNANTTYYYKVRAVKSGLNSNFTATANATTNATTPTAPGTLTASPVSSTGLSLSWQDNSDNETGFEIHRSLTAGSGHALVTTVAANVTTYTDNSLTSGTTYYYQVRAVNGAGSSAFSNEASATTNSSSRVTNSLQVLYNFREGSGNVVNDVSGVGTAMDLTIATPANAQWQSGQGLKTINTGTIINAAGDATKIINAVKASNEITMEAWIIVDDPDANGPARILTISFDGNQRGATLGQNGFESPPVGNYFITTRLNTSDPNVTVNGTPNFSTNETYLPSDLHHVVYTRNTSGTEQIYVDGVSVETGSRGGDFSSWA